MSDTSALCLVIALCAFATCLTIDRSAASVAAAIREAPRGK